MAVASKSVNVVTTTNTTTSNNNNNNNVKAAFNNNNNLFTGTLDLELRKKLVKCYICMLLKIGCFGY
jgi:hypothetical protein